MANTPAKKAAPAATMDSKEVAERVANNEIEPGTIEPEVVTVVEKDVPANRPDDLDADAEVKVKVVTPETHAVRVADLPYNARAAVEAGKDGLTEEEQYGLVLKPKEPFVSEGMRQDILQYGHATDPTTGLRVERA